MVRNSLKNAEAGGVEKPLAQDGTSFGIVIHSFTKKWSLAFEPKQN